MIRTLIYDIAACIGVYGEEEMRKRPRNARAASIAVAISGGFFLFAGMSPLLSAGAR